MFDKTELQHASTIIEFLIEITPDRPEKWEKITFAQKLNRLSELIDALRFDGGHLDTETALKTFRPNKLFADPSAGKIHFLEGGSKEHLNEFAAQKLMLPLLDYLFTHPGNGKGVLAIMRGFVREYLPKCRLVDFERTVIGVLRIKTIVRFAAHNLRKSGLLQYTRAEAYKTWRLSLLGILAADHFRTDLAASTAPPLRIWQESILQRLEPLETMEHLISKLEKIAKLPKIAWAEKYSFLSLTMDVISKYRVIFSTDNKTNLRQRESLAEDLLLNLNASPAAEYIVCAFDGVPAEHLTLLE